MVDHITNAIDHEKITVVVFIDLKKTYVWYDKSRTSFSHIRIKLDYTIDIAGEEIEQLNCTKFLGAFVDDKSNWTNHILKVKNKLSKSISVIYRSSAFFFR